MVKTAGVLTSCKRINSKRITASEPQQANHCKRTTASEPQQANHCEVSREDLSMGEDKKAGKEGKYT